MVLPTLGDRLEFLESTLRSCKELAAEVSTTVAMVVPASATEARALGARYGATLVDDPGSGMADAVNAGLAVRTSEDFYVWVGDDDELVPAGVLALMEALDDRDSAVVAYGHCDYIDKSDSLIGRNRAGGLATAAFVVGPRTLFPIQELLFDSMLWRMWVVSIQT